MLSVACTNKTMFDFFSKHYKITFWLVIIAEILSFIGHLHDIVNSVLFIVIGIGVILLSLWRLEYGFWIVCTELFIGSFGYMFFYDAGDFRFSIRLAIFLGVFIGWLVLAIREKRVDFFKLKVTIPFVIFLATLFIGIIIGITNDHSIKDVFLDVNGYLFFGLLLIAPAVLRSWIRVKQFMQILFAAVTAVCIKTFFLLFYFSHQTDENLFRLVYTWVRDTRVGEIAPIVSNYYRIFFQGHIWVLFTLIILILIVIKIPKRNRDRTTNIYLWILILLSSTTIVISYSRSIWLAFGVTIITLFVYLLWKEKMQFGKLLKIALVFIMVAAINLLLITAIVNVPLPGSGGGGISAISLVQKRFTTDEPAAKSRFQLLNPLVDKYTESPIFGSGFATEVSYQTLDPRTKDLDGGWYTTYSFEWGYLDILVKIGAVGLIAYLWLLVRILKNGIASVRRSSNQLLHTITVSLIFCLIALITTHTTTPYLNHPLGIFLIVLLASISLPTLYNTEKTTHYQDLNERGTSATIESTQ